jgi:hypothetical protein
MKKVTVGKSTIEKGVVKTTIEYKGQVAELPENPEEWATSKAPELVAVKEAIAESIRDLVEEKNVEEKNAEVPSTLKLPVSHDTLQIAALGKEALYRRLNLEERFGGCDEPFPVPADIEFDEEGEEFLTVGDLKILCDAVQEEFSEQFWFLEEAAITLFWKRDGGGGNFPVLAKLSKPSGLLYHYSDSNYVVWFAANHLRQRNVTNWQMVSLMFHELKHTSISENGQFGTRKHDFEGFYDELAIFGKAMPDHRKIIEISQQKSLFDLFEE